MEKSTKEIFNDKIKLIYEYNKTSPIFARIANLEMENNNIEKALEILSEGLKLYPWYTVAYFVLGKAFSLMGNYEQAENAIRFGSELIHSPATEKYYLVEIEKLKEQRTLFSKSRGSAFFPTELERKKEPEPDLFIPEEEPEAPKQKPPVQQKKEVRKKKLTEEKIYDDEFDDLDRKLEELAKEISTAKIPRLSEADENVPEENLVIEDSDENMIISETLAKIYMAQGEYKEAIEVYKKLINKHPENEKDYKKKIEELRNEMGQ